MVGPTANGFFDNAQDFLVLNGLFEQLLVVGPPRD